MNFFCDWPLYFHHIECCCSDSKWLLNYLKTHNKFDFEFKSILKLFNIQRVQNSPISYIGDIFVSKCYCN
jgi:hypothetical protein